jgi:chromosome partitioning protein
LAAVRTIAIGNQKGGVAKTTTCLSLGACLTELGYSVLLIDLDPQANLTSSVGIQPQKLHRAIGDALLGNTTLVSVSRESGLFNLDIAPANQELALVDKLLYGRRGFEYHLKNRLQAMGSELYDLVVIDCPPSFGTLTLNALSAADLLIIPVQCEFYAALSLRRIMGLAKLVKAKTNACLTYKVLITMYDRRNKICRIIHNRMQQDLNQALFKTIIEVDTKLRESPAYGQPVTVYAPNTRGAQQYRAVTREVMGHG